MVDKKINNVYIYHSPATDVTGTNLATALGCKHGSKPPKRGDACMIIGWGAKTDEPIKLDNVPVLNHPDKIRLNRNKFSALEAMKKAGVSVAPFIKASDAASIGKKGCEVALPVIGRRNFHQGGKGFWMCPTMSHVTQAMNEEKPAQYFQTLIEIKDEFRVHVMGGEAIYGVKKVQRTVKEMEEAYVRHELDRQKSLAEKNGDAFDEPTAKLMLTRQAKKFAQDGANQMIRSNRLGWKFSHVKSVDKALAAEAVKACSALGLDFGAVDCCTDASGKVFIIEVNTGPGLEESPFAAYVAAFKAIIEDKLNPKGIVEKAAAFLKPGKKASLAEKAAAAVAGAEEGSVKAAILQRYQLALELTAAASEQQAKDLEDLFRKVLG